MNIRLNEVPFSYFGSYLCFSVLPEEWAYRGLVMRTMRGAPGDRELFHMRLLKDGIEQDYEVIANPWSCVLKCPDGQVEICFSSRDSLRFRGAGVMLRMISVPSSGQYAFPSSGGGWQLNSPPTRSQYLFTPLGGRLSVASDLLISDESRDPLVKNDLQNQSVTIDIESGEDEIFELCCEEFLSSPGGLGLVGDFALCIERAEADWQNWLSMMPPVPERYAAAAELAMYLNYESTVGPGGHLSRDTMLMSKNWMTSCWSWDHCFNAIALSYLHPDMAWDQLNIHFDLQDEFGCLPDMVNARDIGWNFCKPPIHGWALSKMMCNNDLLTESRLRDFYPKLCKWTEWWFKYRDADGDGLPEYNHGNDSGWDNASVFDNGFPVAGPDLAAFLVLQMDLLAELAARLGLVAESESWRTRSDSILNLAIGRLWDGEQFRSRKAFGGEFCSRGDSLINFIPIVLGERLPLEIRDKIAAELESGGRFVRGFGVATENPESPCYVESGYWRGPVWAPVLLLIVDGLVRGGYPVQAKEIARQYCEMCREKMVFAENYDPLTGAPLCDRAYTWASSVFLVLASEIINH